MITIDTAAVESIKENNFRAFDCPFTMYAIAYDYWTSVLTGPERIKLMGKVKDSKSTVIVLRRCVKLLEEMIIAA